MPVFLNSCARSTRLPGCVLAMALWLVSAAAAAQSITAPVVSSVSATLTGQAITKTEPINIKGTVRVRTTVVPDLDFRSTPVVLVNIEFLRLGGDGVKVRGRYTVEETIEKIRTLTATDTLDVTFPIVREGSTAGELKTVAVGVAVLTLSFNTKSGKLTGVTGTLNTSPF